MVSILLLAFSLENWRAASDGLATIGKRGSGPLLPHLLPLASSHTSTPTAPKFFD